MHQTALYFGTQFFKLYASKISNPQIVEIGSRDVNGTLRRQAPQPSTYIGLDMEAGPGVDQVLADPYQIPLSDQSVDVIVSSSCFEHVEFFWLSYLEMLRVLRPHGLLYINAPSNGIFHRYPQDCWRFFPDSAQALARWGMRNNYQAQVLESFVGTKDNDWWCDSVMIFIKDPQYASTYQERITDHYTKAVNIQLFNQPKLKNFSERIDR
jgi:SAM-dependent methyltransferase